MTNVSEYISLRLHQKPKYRYDPIASARLSTLHAGERSSPLRISLHSANLTDRPVYETLSYTWVGPDGDSIRSVPIDCDGSDIWVTKNCELALLNLRKRDEARTLWVDSICINQDDIPERSHQVGLMGMIYGRASQALIWLGEDSEDVDEITKLPLSTIFLTHLGRMMAEMRELKMIGKPMRDSLLYQRLTTEAMDADKGADPTALYRGFKDILLRTWWRRIWVVQEAFAVKASLLICSGTTVDFADFYSFYKYIKYDEDEADLAQKQMLTSHTAIIRNFFSLIRNSEEEVHFMNRGKRMDILLSDISQLHATDSRDKIFGILGLYQPFTAILPAPDYHKAMTEVYMDVVKAYIENFKTLTILELKNSPESTPNLPSWIPDWSVPRLIISLKSATRPIFKAALDSEPLYSIDGRILRVKGKIIDEVKEISAAEPETYKPYWIETVVDRIPGFKRSCELGLSLSTYSTGETIVKVVSQTLCWSFDHYRDMRLDTDLSEEFADFYNILKADVDIEEIGRRLIESKDRFYQRIIHRSSAPLFVTEKGLLAAALYTTRVGDCVAIFSGGNMPYIIRPVGDHYELVGSCYVYGVMDGEMFPSDPNLLDWFSIH